jgi:uncharacterized protein (TIGR03083 family)
MSESHDTYVHWLEMENQAFAGACERDLTADVPTCPGWTVRDLLAHQASFQAWITTIVTDRILDPAAPTPIAPPDSDDHVDWYRSIGTQLVTALRSSPADAHVWSVTNQQTVGAWARRQASDTSVHRWDAQNATGYAEPIAHAADHISEMFEHLLPGLIKSFGAPVPHGTLALRSTDTTDSWTMTTADDLITIAHDHTPADVTLSGTASDLLLALWNRPSNADTDGDPRVLTEWRRSITGG